VTSSWFFLSTLSYYNNLYHCQNSEIEAYSALRGQ